MAESDNFRSDFSRAMDCHVCMDRLDDPKVLSCQHSYCKSCLDNLIKFQSDGSGIITCPLGCNSSSNSATASSRTLIPAHQTTNDLPIPYQLKSILDVFNKQSIKHESLLKKLDCAGTHGCANEASVYCLVCKILLCPGCMQSHETTHASQSVQYDRQTEQIRLVCSIHRTVASYFCCDTMICVYCKHREHILHKEAQTIKEQASKVKEILLHPEYGVGNVEGIITNTAKNAEATELSISILRSMLQKTLRNRNLKGLREYLSRVQREEKRIIDKFDEVVSQQLKLYPRNSTNLYCNILEKEDFEIVLRKNDIVHNASVFSKTIPVLNIGLTDSTTLQPLGDLDVKSGDFVKISDRRIGPSVSLSSTGFNQNEPGSKDLETLRCRLNDVMQSIEEICGHQAQHKQVKDNKCPESSMDTILQSSPRHHTQGATSLFSSSVSTEKNSSIDAASSSSSHIEQLESVMSELNKGKGIECIRNLCKWRKQELMLSMLELRPSVVSMTNKMKNTPLHFAASFGCAKVLSRLLSMDHNTMDTPNALGSTPLHYAIEGGHVDCVEMLLSSNCQTELENASGYTALALAKKRNNDEIIALFQRYGID